MRILFLSNFFPPHSRGGYEQWCQEVAVELAGRGHQVAVQTSRAAASPKVVVENGVTVHRQLFLEVEDGLGRTMLRLLRERRRVEAANLDFVRGIIADFRPDAALIWGMWNIPRMVSAQVEQLLSSRVGYYICDYWLSLPNAYIQRWEEPSRHILAQLPKRVLGNFFLHRLKQEQQVDLCLEHPICVSKAVRRLLGEAGLPMDNAKTIYGGTQIDEFQAVESDRWQRTAGDRLRVVYIGRLSREKGVHTIIEAMKQLAEKGYSNIYLDLVGAGDKDYEAMLRSLVAAYRLTNSVILRGRVSRSEIPTIMAGYDVLVFPSEWEEPFARTVLEAMAAGLTVVGTTTGGTGEILIDGETGLTFPAGHSATLAKQIMRLADNPLLCHRLGKTGMYRVVRDFSFTRMVDQIEVILEDIRYAAREEV